MRNIQEFHIAGTFDEKRGADAAVDELRRLGFAGEKVEIGLERREPWAATGGAHSDWEEGAIVGAMTGAGVGGIVGLGVVTGIVSPIAGPLFLAGGTTAVILTNVVGGSALVGLVGALIGAGLSDHEAGAGDGSEAHPARLTVTVHTGDRYTEAVEVLAHSGAHDLHCLDLSESESPDRPDGAAPPFVS